MYARVVLYFAAGALFLDEGGFPQFHMRNLPASFGQNGENGFSRPISSLPRRRISLKRVSYGTLSSQGHPSAPLWS